MYEHVISFYYQNSSARTVAYYMSMRMSFYPAHQLMVIWVASSLGLSAVFLVSKLVCFVFKICMCV